jgi:RNA polymerase sigma-70 factor (ECF subfamily)
MQEKQETFWKLLEPEYVRASLFCRKLMSDRDSADDLMQDAMITALTKFHQLRETSSFRPWLYRIIINSFRMTVRRPWWKRRVALSPESAAEHATTNPADRLEARRWLGRAFQAISPEEQALVALHELEQWSIVELADLYAKSETAIKTRLFRARRKMKEELLRLTRAGKTKGRSEHEVDGNNECVAARSSID